RYRYRHRAGRGTARGAPRRPPRRPRGRQHVPGPHPLRSFVERGRRTRRGDRAHRPSRLPQPPGDAPPEGDAMTTRGLAFGELPAGTPVASGGRGALPATVGMGARQLTAGGLRGEAEDTTQRALEALLFDARHAGWDPAAAGVEAIVQALADHLVLTAD